MIQFKRTCPYTQQEVSEQIGHIGTLIKQQKEHPSMLATEAIETSREVLAFMMDEVKRYQDDIRSKAKS